MLKQNPIRRIKQQTEHAAMMAVQSAESHSVQAPGIKSMASAGAVDSTTLQWKPFGRFDIDIFDSFVMA